MAYTFRYVTTNLYQSGSSANPIIAELPFTNVNFTQQLNSIGTFQGEVLLSGINSTNLNVYNGTIPGKTILWVIYNDTQSSNSYPVWSGVIWNREYDSDSQILHITAQEMLSLYQRRRISDNKNYTTNTATITGANGAGSTVIYYANNKFVAGQTISVSGVTPSGFNFSSKAIVSCTPTTFIVNSTYGGVYSSGGTATGTGFDPTYIAQDLMQYTEGKTHGKTGLAYSVQSSTYAAARTYHNYEFKSVYQAVKDLAQNFFDFAIIPDSTTGNLINTFTIGIPLGATYSASDPTSAVFQFPGNIISYKFPEDGQTAANTLYGLGYGANNSKLTATAIDGSKITTGDWPLLEDAVNYIDVSDTTLLKNLTLGRLNAVSYPPTTVDIVIPTYVDPYYYKDYSIGDTVQVRITDDYFPTGLNLVMRIVALSVNPGENNPDRVTVTLTRELAAGTVSQESKWRM